MHFSQSDSCLSEIILYPEISGGLVSRFDIKAIYNGEDITHFCNAGEEPERGIMVVQNNGYLCPQFDVSGLVTQILYRLSAITLQADAFYDVSKTLSNSVTNFKWELPDGRQVPNFSDNTYPRYIHYVTPQMLELVKPLTSQDWIDLSSNSSANANNPPLWRMMLADAYRERKNDIRNTVTRCATTLDVAIQPLMPPNIYFNITLLNGDLLRKGKARTPDLRITDGNLYDVIAKLWYSRHGIVHKGECNLYDRRPENGVLPIRPLNYDDITEFLGAVPRVIDYVFNNPP